MRVKGQPSARSLALVIAGLIILIGGAVYWSLETEYGSGLNFSVERGPGGRTIVYEIGADGTERPVFEGSEQAAGNYTEERRQASENLLLPTMLGVGGAVVLAGGLLVWRREQGQHGA